MLKTPNRDVSAALAALEGNPNFETVRRWLQESREDLSTSIALSRDEVVTRWQQGSLQALDEILTSASAARTVIHNHNQRSR